MMINVGAGGEPQGARRRGQLLGTGPLNVASLEARQDFKIDSQGAREYRCDRPINHGTTRVPKAQLQQLEALIERCPIGVVVDNDVGDELSHDRARGSLFVADEVRESRGDHLVRGRYPRPSWNGQGRVE